MHRSAAGGLAGLRCRIGLRCRTGRGPSRAGRAEFHEGGTAATVCTAKTTAAARSGREAAEGDHEAQGTAHDWHLHHRRARSDPWSDTMRRPRRRLPNRSSRSAARSDGRHDFSKKFSYRSRLAIPTLPMGREWGDCANWPGSPAAQSARNTTRKYVLLLRTVDD